MSSDPLGLVFRQLLRGVWTRSGGPISLIDALRTAPVEASALGLASDGLYEEDFAQFQQLVMTSRKRFHGLFPSVAFGDDVMPANTNKAAVRNYFGDTLNAAPSPRPSFFRNIETEIQQRIDRGINGNDIENHPIPTFITTSVAIEIFVARFTGGLRQTSATAGGAVVTVHSVNPGYAVRYTPRWLFSVNAFGSSLSTPVMDQLAPASYRFGGDKNGSLTWDSAIHSVTTPATSTRVTAF